MRDALHWFGYFVLVCVLIGWAEVGTVWILCQSLSLPHWFWATLGFPMSLNMCLSFLWLGAVQNAREAKKQKKTIADRVKLKRSQQ
jgi:hypothetical protein